MKDACTTGTARFGERDFTFVMHKTRAFTLIELLVVIAIIALLMGIMWHRAFVPTEPKWPQWIEKL